MTKRNDSQAMEVMQSENRIGEKGEQTWVEVLSHHLRTAISLLTGFPFAHSFLTLPIIILPCTHSGEDILR